MKNYSCLAESLFQTRFIACLAEELESWIKMLENILVVYLVFVNIAAFGMYGIDKQKAIRKQWRIPEAQLLAVAAIGGSAGALLGMQFFHHKIRKWKFRLGVPLILAAQLILWRVLQ